MKSNKAKTKGFTLVELVVVVAIIGVIAVIVAPKIGGVLSSFTSQSRMLGAEQIAGCIDMYRVKYNLSSNDPTNVPNFLESGNTLLDVFMDGDVAIVAAADFNYNSSKVRCNGIKKLLDTTTAATAGTPGVYTYKGTNSIVTLTNPSSEEYGVRFSSVLTEEVLELAVSEGKATSFDGSAVGSAGPINWDAASGGSHNMTIHIAKL